MTGLAIGFLGCVFLAPSLSILAVNFGENSADWFQPSASAPSRASVSISRLKNKSTLLSDTVKGYVDNVRHPGVPQCVVDCESAGGIDYHEPVNEAAAPVGEVGRMKYSPFRICS
jgi:hypothetical protein